MSHPEIEDHGCEQRNGALLSRRHKVAVNKPQRLHYEYAENREEHSSDAYTQEPQFELFIRYAVKLVVQPRQNNGHYQREQYRMKHIRYYMRQHLQEFRLRTNKRLFCRI